MAPSSIDSDELTNATEICSSRCIDPAELSNSPPEDVLEAVSSLLAQQEEISSTFSQMVSTLVVALEDSERTSEVEDAGRKSEQVKHWETTAEEIFSKQRIISSRVRSVVDDLQAELAAKDQEIQALQGRMKHLEHYASKHRQPRRRRQTMCTSTRTKAESSWCNSSNASFDIREISFSNNLVDICELSQREGNDMSMAGESFQSIRLLL